MKSPDDCANPLAGKFVIVYDGTTSTTEIMKGLIGGPEEVQWIKSSEYNARKFIKFTPIFIRCTEPKLEAEVHFLIKMKMPFAYYIDDNFWLLDDDSDLGRFYKHPLIRRTLTLFVRNATTLICNTKTFKHFLDSYNPRCIVLEPHFDFDCISHINNAESPHPDEFRIGIIASPSRLFEISRISKEILRVINETPSNLVFELIGACPKELISEKRVRVFPTINDYKKFLQLQASRKWNIALAPLQDNEFSRYKTNNKYREYGGCGIAGIYSNISIYSECIIDGHNGILVDENNTQNTDQWHKAIMHCYNFRDETKKMGQHAKLDVLNKYSLETIKHQWFDALLKLSPSRIPILRQLLSRRIEQNIKHHISQSPIIITPESSDVSIDTPSRPSAYLLKPMQTIETTATLQCVAKRIYIISIATFGVNPEGWVEIEATEAESGERLSAAIIEPLRDNMSFEFSVNQLLNHRPKVRVSNFTKSSIAVYKLDGGSESIYPEQEITLRGCFVA